MNPNDLSKIVPDAIPKGGAVITDVDLSIRILLDYDADERRDRIVGELFLGGEIVSGAYSYVYLPRDYPGPATVGERREALRLFAPEVEAALMELLRQRIHSSERPAGCWHS